MSRKLYPNVDFYSGIVQKAIGIPVPLFTAIFALARTVGWIAQLNEMIADPEYKIGRPRQLFTGATRRSVKPIGERCERRNSRADRTHDRHIEVHHEQHAGIGSDQHAVRRQRAVHRGAVRALPRDPDVGRAPTGAPISTRCAAARPTSRMRRSIESFIALGKSRKVAGAMVDAATMHKQVLVLQLIGKFRTLGMFHADLDPLKRQERRYIADLDLATYGFTDADLDTEFDVGSFKAGPQRMRLRDLDRGAEGDVLPHVRRRVHVHLGHARPSASSRSGSSRSARGPTYTRRAEAAHPRAADRRRDARALPAHEVRRAEALLRRRRRHDDPDARPPDPEAPAPRACRRS